MQKLCIVLRRYVVRAILAAGLGALGALPVLAQDQVANEAAPEAEPRLPQASLTASASAQAHQDTVKITLTTQVSDKNRAKLSAALDSTLESVVKQAKAEARVKAYSGNYHVWPVHNDKGQINGWQGRADVMLESTDFGAASELAGQLSDRMAISNLYFFVSAPARQKIEAELLDDAAKAFTNRALAVARAFGYGNFRIKTLALDGAGADYAPMPRLMVASAEKANVPLEAGTENITVSVRGSVYLLPSNK